MSAGRIPVWAGIVAQCTKLLIKPPVSPIRAPVLGQLPVNVPGKSAENSPSAWATWEASGWPGPALAAVGF